MVRPTKYTDEEVNSLANQYLDECDFKDELPNIAGFAVYVKVCRDTVYEWMKCGKYPMLSDTLALLASEQENKLIQRSLKGEYNSNISKLLLHNHGYSDRQQINQDMNISMGDAEAEQVLREAGIDPDTL